jgi:RNA polymerase sigma-70 factor, ECF subfamily
MQSMLQQSVARATKLLCLGDHGSAVRRIQINAMNLERQENCVRTAVHNGIPPQHAEYARNRDTLFEQDFEFYSRKIFRLAYRLLGSREEAEDAVQEVWIGVHQRAYTFRGNSRFSTWLYRLAFNTVLARLRVLKRRKTISYEDYMPRFAQEGCYKMRPIVDWSNKIEDQIYNKELRQILYETLNQLKPIDRTVVILSDVQDYTDREIARFVGLTASAVKARLHRSRLFLRGRLAAHFERSPAPPGGRIDHISTASH